METDQRTVMVKIMVVITFLSMIVINAMANILPINGINTGQVSDAYPNIFAPAGSTFAIWGLIYLLLAGYVLYSVGFFRENKNDVNAIMMHKIGIIFSVSSIANGAWIFSWHYQIIPLSMVLMATILACLILINRVINDGKLSKREKFFVRLPFSVYFGWITVATIANFTTLFVSLDWGIFSVNEGAWTVFILIVGLIIGIATMLKNMDIAYGIVIVWAYGGILLKHMSSEGFGNKYPEVVAITIFSIMILIISAIYIFISNKRR